MATIYSPTGKGDAKGDRGEGRGGEGGAGWLTSKAFSARPVDAAQWMSLLYVETRTARRKLRERMRSKALSARSWSSACTNHQGGQVSQCSLTPQGPEIPSAAASTTVNHTSSSTRARRQPVAPPPGHVCSFPRPSTALYEQQELRYLEGQRALGLVGGQTLQYLGGVHESGIPCSIRGEGIPRANLAVPGVCKPGVPCSRP